MDEREELMALRRLAELEAKAGGMPYSPAAPKQKESSTLGNLAAGAISGVADIGDTILNAATYLPGKVIPAVKEWNDERTAGLQSFNDDHKDSTAFNAGRVGGNVIATLPVGGVIGAGVKAISAAPKVQALGNAIASGGFRAGTVAPTASGMEKTINVLTRVMGGGVSGGAAAGLINPDDAGTGAVIGAALPPAVQGVGKVAGYVGRSAGSVVKPFMPSGQREIAGNIVREFAKGGPTAVNAAEIVPGSVPTLAEATGNAGLATLQRGVRDVRPNAFAEREAMNAAARLGLFDDVAKDAAAITAAKAERQAAAGPLYEAAKGAQVPSDDVLLDILQRPSASKAWARAQKLAAEKGETLVAGKDMPEQVAFVGGKTEKVPGAHGHSRTVQLPGLVDESGAPLTTTIPAQSAQYSGRGLHYLKMALDDLVSDASAGIGANERAAILNTKEQLASWMGDKIPEYGQAAATYAEKSRPINAMETLQGLRLTDAQGNITLAKVKNAIDGLRRQQGAQGINGAKSVSDEQMQALQAIYDDLLRQSNTSLGKSIGSNTFQNIATDNILSNVGGKWVSALANKSGAAGVLGQVGRLAYSGPNEAIRGRLVDMMLNPAEAEAALRNQQAQGALTALLERLSSSPALPAGYRVAPALSGPLLSSDR